MTLRSTWESRCTCRATPLVQNPPGRQFPVHGLGPLPLLGWRRAGHAELLPEGAYTGARLAAWVSSNFATATYSETTNSLSVAYDGNRLELRQQFPDAADYPAAPPASPTDHMLGPSFVSGGQQVFEFVRMMAHNEVYLRCAQLANATTGQPGRRHPLQDHAEEWRGHHCGDGLRRRALHGPQGPRHLEVARAFPQRQSSRTPVPSCVSASAGCFLAVARASPQRQSSRRRPSGLR